MGKISAFVFNTRAEAEAALARLDAELGYPRAGRQIGDGHDGDAEPHVTATCSEVVKHPTEERWIVPHPGEVVELDREPVDVDFPSKGIGQ